MKFKDEFVSAPWGKICVIRGGQSGKALLLVHGVMDNGGGLQLLASRIHPEYRVFIVELPGCGHSDPFLSGLPLQLEIFVEVIRRVVDHYDLKEFYYVGHSLGVKIGLLYNSVYPGAIQKFIALDSLLYPPTEAEQYQQWYKDRLEAYFKEESYKKKNSPPHDGPNYTFNEALALVMKNRGISKEVATAILQRSLKVLPSTDKYRFTWDQRFKLITIPHFSTQFQIDFFKSVKIPFLLISAQQSVEKHVNVNVFTIMKSFYDNNANFQFEIIKGNHDVHLNEMPRISNMISQFFQSDGVSKVARHTSMEYFKMMEKNLKEKNANLKSKL